MDDDDLMWIALAASDDAASNNRKPPWIYVLLLIAFAFLFFYWITDSAKEDCEKTRCDRGSPMLVKNFGAVDCLCVEKAGSGGQKTSDLK